MSSSECRRHSPPSPTVPQMACMSRPYSASNTAARWSGITPSGSTGTRSNYSRRPIRPSYAGSFVEVQERLDGELVVQQGNSTIPTQEAPPRPGALRALNGAGGRDANELGGLLRSLPRYNVKDRKTRTRTNGGQQGKAQAAPTAHSTPEGSMEGCPES